MALLDFWCNSFQLGLNSQITTFFGGGEHFYVGSIFRSSLGNCQVFVFENDNENSHDRPPKRYFCALWTTGRIGLQPDCTNTQTTELSQNFMFFFF